MYVIFIGQHLLEARHPLYNESRSLIVPSTCIRTRVVVRDSQLRALRKHPVLRSVIFVRTPTGTVPLDVLIASDLFSTELVIISVRIASFG